jgi:predicted enzyme related to lactoylglutathione lyase
VPSTWFCTSIDSADPARLADFWSQALGYEVRHELPNGSIIIAQAPGATPALAFLRVPETKRAKNRLHVDLSPDDQEAEAERLIALGATRADVGQPPDAPWVVLADPEGNEFCLIPPVGSG